MGLRSWPVLMKRVFLTSAHLSNLDEITPELKSREGYKRVSEDRQGELIHSSAPENPACVYWLGFLPLSDSLLALKPSSIFVLAPVSPSPAL